MLGDIGGVKDLLFDLLFLLFGGFANFNAFVESINMIKDFQKREALKIKKHQHK